MRSTDVIRQRAAQSLVFKALSLLLLLVLFAGHGLPGLHFAAVAHEICVEHGALHHADSVEAPSEAAPRGPSREVAVSQGFALDHHHDHCSAVAVATDRALASRAGFSEWAERTLWFETPIFAAARGESSVELLSYAPKLPPPA